MEDYQVKTHCTKRMIKNGVMAMFLSVHYRTTFKMLQTFLMMLSIFVVIVGAGEVIGGRTAIGVVWVVLAILYFIIGAGFPVFLGWLMWMGQSKQRLDVEASFGEQITLRDGKKEKHYNYRQVKVLLESGKCFYVCLGLGAVFPLEKAGFQKGKPEEFGAYLKKKCPQLVYEQTELRE